MALKGSSPQDATLRSHSSLLNDLLYPRLHAKTPRIWIKTCKWTKFRWDQKQVQLQSCHLQCKRPFNQQGQLQDWQYDELILVLHWSSHLCPRQRCWRGKTSIWARIRVERRMAGYWHSRDRKIHRLLRTYVRWILRHTSWMLDCQEGQFRSQGVVKEQKQ